MIVNPGLRRFCAGGVGGILRSAELSLANITHTAIPARGAVTPSFTRASPKTIVNNDGYQVTLLNNELGFPGARRVYNEWTTSSVTLASGANKSLTLTAGTYQFSMGAGTGTATFSGTGGATGALAASASTRVSVAKTVTAGTFVVTASVADLNNLQVCNITAETDQTTIREYVSVGVESAPAYHGSMQDGIRCFPYALDGSPLTGMTTPLIELAGTNLCLQSNAFTTTWTAVGTPAATQNAVGPDGATSAWTLTDNDAGVWVFIYQSILLTAATYTSSVFVKKTTGAQASYPILYVDDTASFPYVALCTIDTSNGVATVWTAYTGFTVATSSATCVSYNSNYWRVSLTFLATATNWRPFLIPAGTTNATQATGALNATAQGSAVFYGAQIELGTKATSYIPRGTAVDGSGTRNADALYYTGALIGTLNSLAVVDFKREAGFANDGHVVSVSDNTTTNYADFSLTTATAIAFEGKATAQQWNQTTGTYTPAAKSSAAWSMATNDVKSALDGAAQTQDTTATVPTVTRLEIAMLAGAEQLNGYPGKVYGWTRNLSQSEENAITA